MSIRKKVNTDPLAPVMAEKGLDNCPEGLSARLTEMTIRSYKRNYKTIYRKEEWPGKIILAILVLLNGWILYMLPPVPVSPLLVAGIMAFALAAIVLVRFNKNIP